MTAELWSLLIDSFWKILLPGLTMTIPLTVISFAFALVIAVVTALVQFAGVRGLRQVARFYIWVIRGTPGRRGGKRIFGGRCSGRYDNYRQRALFQYARAEKVPEISLHGRKLCV